MFERSRTSRAWTIVFSEPKAEPTAEPTSEPTAEHLGPRRENSPSDAIGAPLRHRRDPHGPPATAATKKIDAAQSTGAGPTPN